MRKALSLFVVLLLPLVAEAQVFNYIEGCKKAAKENKKLVVYVGAYMPVGDQPTKIDNAVVAKAVSLGEGYPQSCVVVCVPDGRGWVDHYRTLPYSASAAQIRAEVSPRALPFPLRAGEVADDSDPIRSLRNTKPALADYIGTLESYTTATQTQWTTRRWTGGLGAYPRASMRENFWKVPGHLDGVRGWSSKLYRSNHMPRVFLIRQNQAEIGYDDGVSQVTWSRSYPDGSVFADVLRNERGEVFEVRMAEKTGGEWYRFVAYRDAQATPIGYVRPTRKQCAECHSVAGASNYDGPAIPGADTIISDPFPDLEAGRYISGGYGTRLN